MVLHLGVLSSASNKVWNDAGCVTPLLPACLLYSQVSPLLGARTQPLGWGYLSYHIPLRPSILQAAHLL